MVTDYKIQYFQYHFLLTAILAFIAAGTTGCEHSTAPERSGNIVGNAVLVDQWLRPANNHSGIKVHLDGTSHSDSTDTEGRYELTNVKTGIYTITLGKEGYGTNQIPFFDFVGGGDMYVTDPTNPLGNPKPMVGELPTYQVEIDSTEAPKAGLSRFYISFSETVPDQGTAMVVVFQGSNQNVSADPANYDFFQIFFVPSGYKGFIGDAIVEADRGTTRYLRAYPGAGVSVFSDPSAQSSNWAWASLGSPSEVVSVTVPFDTETVTAADHNINSPLSGEFVLMRTEGDVIERIAITESDTRKEIAKKYQQIRERIADLHDH